jgi:carboxyl-terminal processing protease
MINGMSLNPRMGILAVVRLAVAFLLSAAGASGDEAKPLQTAETFDAAWTIIHDSYYDPTFHGLNWEQLRTELRPKAEAARNIQELRAVIQEMLSRLGGSHMALIPGEIAHSLRVPRLSTRDSSAPRNNSSQESGVRSDAQADTSEDRDLARGGDGELGCDLRWNEGRALITRVDPDGPAGMAGVRPGWLIESIDGEPVADTVGSLPPELPAARKDFLAWQMINVALSGAAGSHASLRFLDGHDQPVPLRLQRRKKQGEPAKLGYLPTFYARLEADRLKSERGGLVGVVRFNLWMIPIVHALDQHIDEFRHADGLILDLRGNLGGIGGMILGISGHFLNDRVSLGTLKMRGNELQFFANPRRVSSAGDRVEPYSGPLAILVDELSLSAAEIFAGGMQALGRARVFGQASGGQALPAVWDRLPNGDVLYHAFGDFVTSNGVRLEGRGVLPDQAVPLRRADLLAGRDEPMLAALRWISNRPAEGASTDLGGAKK